MQALHALLLKSKVSVRQVMFFYDFVSINIIYYDNYKISDLPPPPLRFFTQEEVDEIRKITLWDIIVNASSVEPNEIQRNVFVHKLGDVCPQPEQLNASHLEPCKFLEGHDYFSVS